MDKALEKGLPNSQPPTTADVESAPTEPESEWIRRSYDINGATVTYHIRRGDDHQDYRARGRILGEAFRRLGSL